MNKRVSKSLRRDFIYENFGMYVVFGGLLIIVGIIVAGLYLFAALATTFLFGLLLFIAGFVLLLQSFVSGKWTVFIVQLFCGVLLMGSGFLTMINPSISIALFTLLLSLVFLTIGISKITTSAIERDFGWEWGFTCGITIFICGLLIWRLPAATSIGLLLGFGIIVTGISELIAGVKLHNNSIKNNLAVQ